MYLYVAYYCRRGKKFDFGLLIILILARVFFLNHIFFVRIPLSQRIVVSLKLKLADHEQFTIHSKIFKKENYR